MIIDMVGIHILNFIVNTTYNKFRRKKIQKQKAEREGRTEQFMMRPM